MVARGTDIVFDGLGVTSRGGVAPSRLSAVALPGAITVLTGPNGCGKSTAVHALLGLIEPSSGRVTVAGKVLAPDLRRPACMHQRKPDGERNNRISTTRLGNAPNC